MSQGTTTPPVSAMPVTDVRFVKELYPRLKPSDEVIERYRDAIDNLPPITVARGGIIVDGYHRWQAHVREDAETIDVVDLGNLSDAEIVRESIQRNATHGHQLTRADKKKLAGQLWVTFADMNGNRVTEIAQLLAVSERTVQDWTKDARKAEKEEQQARAWDLWLDCLSYRAIADAIGVDDKTVAAWCAESAQNCGDSAPDSRQHFDVWQFKFNSRDAGQQSYFGALAPQVMENLLWFFTDPGDIVVDLFAGTGTTIEVGKRMGRRVWAADIKGDKEAPYLPIHEADAVKGWPSDAPAKAKLVFLDPPYWKQAAGKYSDSPADLANQSLEQFYASWSAVVDAAMKHAELVAYIVSPAEMRPDSSIDGHPVDVVDLAVGMLDAFTGWRVHRRIIVPYQTQQATGQQVEWARANRRMLKLYRDLVVMHRA